ncbi:uncharacterized protein PG986_000501 [Apiospora aurea]|uniref:Uncharacterized protein n=1 Tax=Apiospora aurea TaxID=335848 RepID=A0ABR1QUE7_9PEZI
MLPNTILALFAGTAAAAAVSSSSSRSRSTISSADSCSTQTVCADYVNACGQMYGGCFSACTPWPTFTPPPCTLNTISTSTTGAPATTITSAPSPPSVKASSTSTSTGGLPCAGSRLCADHVRTCGTTAVLTFGGCYPACSPSPLYTAPPCPTGAPDPGVTPPPAAGKPCNRSTACQDLLRTCGTSTVLTYGG